MVRINILKRQFRITLLSLFLPFLFFPQAYSVESTSVSVPSDFGKVDKIQTGTNNKTIVLIQSAHVHYAAQKSIAEILRSLIEKKQLRLILVEGGWGNDSLSHMREYAPQEKRLEVAEQFLKEGKITGDEYLDLTSDLDMMIWGIENAADYKVNMEVFLKLYEVQDQLLAELKKLDEPLSQAETKIFPEDLQDFLNHKKAFHTAVASLPDYLLYLSKGMDVSALASYPNLKQFIAVAKDESFDSAKLDIEKKALMNALSNRVTRLELEQFDFLKGRKSVGEEIEYLKLLLEAHQTHQKKFPNLKVDNLRKYLATLQSMHSASSEGVFSEVARLEEQVFSKFSLNEEQKKLIEIRNTLQLLEKLFSLELTPIDYKQFMSSPNVFIGDLDSRLKRAGMTRASLALALSSAGLMKNQPGMTKSADDIDINLIEEWIPRAAAFYESARKREESLIQNAVLKMNETQEQTVALLIGGFHAKEVAEEFHQLGYTVVTVSPRFGSSTDSEFDSRHYFEILKYKWGAENTAASSLKIS